MLDYANNAMNSNNKGLVSKDIVGVGRTPMEKVGNGWREKLHEVETLETMQYQSKEMESVWD